MTSTKKNEIEGFPVLNESVPDLEPLVIKKARLKVVSMCPDTEDAHYILDVLGLLPNQKPMKSSREVRSESRPKTNRELTPEQRARRAVVRRHKFLQKKWDDDRSMSAEELNELFPEGTPPTERPTY